MAWADSSGTPATQTLQGSKLEAKVSAYGENLFLETRPAVSESPKQRTRKGRVASLGDTERRAKNDKVTSIFPKRIHTGTTSGRHLHLHREGS